MPEATSVTDEQREYIRQQVDAMPTLHPAHARRIALLLTSESREGVAHDRNKSVTHRRPTQAHGRAA
jgi:hypothetical protein